MAVINKDFKVKNGLIVEGASGTINNQTILTEVDGDEYILDLVGGVAFITSVDEAQLDVTEGELSVKTEVFDEFGAAAAAQTAAESYADGLATNYDVAGAAAQALSDAEDYADGLAVNYDVAGAAAAAQTAAESYADGLAVNYDVAGAAAQALSDAEDYADGLATNYEASGAVSTHSDLTTGVHGVTGDVVGTTDTQDISNKRIVDTLYFTDGVTIADEGQIAVRPTTHEFEIKANYGDLDLKTAAEGADVNITSDYGDIILNADGTSYLTSANAGNEIVTKSYVEGLIQGLDVKESVVSASTANFDITINASGGIGGHVLANGDRVLLKNQTNIAENGIYIYSSATQTIVASTDPADTDLNQGAYVLVEKGTNAATGWIVTNTDGGGDTWSQFSAANEYTAGTGITIDANAISVADDTYDAYGAAAQALSDAEDYADGLATNYDVAGAAAQALSDAEDYADGLAVNYDAAGSAATAETNANGYTDTEIGNLDTDDIEEGSTNQYYTTTRAKTDAAALLTGATLENITITGDENGLTITAENGVADSDTDDLTEGTTNFYFTDQRAVDALEAVTPNFVEIDINSIATQIAATVDVPTASTVTAHAFPKADYRSAEYLVKVAHGTHTEISKVLLTLDTSDNIAITEYAIVGTNGSASTISADVSGTDVRLRVATANNSSDVTVVGTLVA
jgi:hypothetical protein